MHVLVLQILQLEMERLSLAKAVSDRNSKQRLQALDGQLKKLKVEQVKTLTSPCALLCVATVCTVAACSCSVLISPCLACVWSVQLGLA